VQAKAVREALAARGVASVYLSERGSVFKTEEAQDLWLLLKALAEPRRAEPLRTAVATRLWGLDDASLGWTLQDEAAWDALQDRCQTWHQIWQRQGVLPMLRHWLHDTLAGQRLLASQGGERRLSNLLHLGELLHQASHTLQGTSALVRHLGEHMQSEIDTPESAQLRLETDAQRVQIVSFHKSKGLEYPFGLVAGAEHFGQRIQQGRARLGLVPTAGTPGPGRFDGLPASLAARLCRHRHRSH
jgi:exodeoxyribonuclease V beta subunit